MASTTTASASMAAQKSPPVQHSTWIKTSVNIFSS